MQAEAARTVSVVIPVFRAEAYVEQAVRSVLEQPEVLEVLLVEDGSPDGSLATCRRLAEEMTDRVRLLRHPGGANRGAGASRNLGVKEARGKYVAFLDADDWMLPGRFSRSLPLLEGEGSVDGVYEATGVHFESDEAQKVWDKGDAGLRLVTITDPPAPDQLAAKLLRGECGYFTTNGIVLRRTVFDRVGGFDEHLRLGQDVALWWKLALACRLVPGQILTPVAMYRRHRGNRATFLDPEYQQASKRWALTVYRWARNCGLAREKVLLARRALAGEVLKCPGDPARGIRLRIRQFAAMARYALLCPSLVAEPLFRQRAVCWLTGRSGDQPG